MIEAHGLSRRFGSHFALRNLDLVLLAGERVVLLGPNGSGKTTLLRILGMALAPTAGVLHVAGQPVGKNTDLRRMVGLVAHRTGLYDDLTPRENLRFYARLYAVPEPEQRIGTVLEDLGLAAVGDQPVRTLSRGMQQRAALARAILHDPQVLLLDEPETGLDADAQEWLGSLVDRWAALGRAVLMTTHRLDWASRIADRVLMLKAGTMAQAELPTDAAGLAQAYLRSLGELP